MKTRDRTLLLGLSRGLLERTGTDVNVHLQVIPNGEGAVKANGIVQDVSESIVAPPRGISVREKLSGTKTDLAEGGTNKLLTSLSATLLPLT